MSNTRKDQPDIRKSVLSVPSDFKRSRRREERSRAKLAVRMGKDPERIRHSDWRDYTQKYGSVAKTGFRIRLLSESMGVQFPPGPPKIWGYNLVEKVPVF